MTCYILVLGHMRSRSSLLAHVLGSSDEILGYSELHMAYRRPLDLPRMRIRLALSTRRVPIARYFLDKILHNAHSVSPAILGDRRVRVIFMVREPEAALRSLIKMSLETGVDHYSTPSNALAYYCERLETLSAYASRTVVGFSIYIDSDDLVVRSDEILGGISKWLDLSKPLQSRYRMFPRTGTFGAGDPLPNIRAGTIIRTTSADEIALAPALLDRARSCYRATKTALGSLRVSS